MTSGRLVDISPRASVQEALARLAPASVSHLLVITRGDLVGVVCACDLDQAPRNAPVAQHMSPRLVTIDANAPALEAALRMLEERVSFLPVLAGSRLVGVVTLSDLGRAGIVQPAPRCASCESEDHVRYAADGVAFCLECRRRSSPDWANDAGGSG